MKTNEKLELTVKERTAELSRSIESLKTAQEQLVQSEKLAALGQMTAGIAHEIQNPLNFVTNFYSVVDMLINVFYLFQYLLFLIINLLIFFIYI